MFLGTSAKLYQIVSGTLTDVSNTGGYTTPYDRFWSFEQFGKAYMHHVNKDPAGSVGDVIKAFWNAQMHRVELLIGVDNEKAPDIAERIANGETLDALLPHTAFIHVKDALGDATKVQFALPGEGTIDYADYFRRLKASNWAGSVCVEVSGQVFGKPGYDPIAAAKKCYAALAPAFRAAGL